MKNSLAYNIGVRGKQKYQSTNSRQVEHEYGIHRYRANTNGMIPAETDRIQKVQYSVPYNLKVWYSVPSIPIFFGTMFDILPTYTEPINIERFISV